jgi:CRP-like cAMP-binding protein
MQKMAFGNHLMSDLSQDDISMLLPLRTIELRQAEYIFRSGDPIEHVIFPQSGVISLLVELRKGFPIEAAMIGREGIIGTSSVAGMGHVINDARVQAAGKAYAVPRVRFVNALIQSSRLRDQVARFNAVLLAQAQQAAACNASHAAQARICRWLLELRDRCDDDIVPMTQSFLAHMVGVQRTTVTLAESSLQAAGVIRCCRGKVQILDPRKLEDQACACYRRMRELRDRMLPNRSDSPIRFVANTLLLADRKPDDAHGVPSARE